MVRGWLPISLGLILIVTLSVYEGVYLKDRWGEAGAEAKELGKRFAEVPKQIGDWTGEDLPVDDIVKKTAGAVHYVSRRYTNASTGREVRLWLIVGHSRDIVRHTPNICYPNSGFRQTGPQQKFYMDVPGETPAVFYTAKFQKEDAIDRHVERVFWAWNHPDQNQWEAPDSARFHYGLAKALYKLYFTSNVMRDEETIDNNVAADFGALAIPAIDAALFPAQPATEPDTAVDADPIEG